MSKWFGVICSFAILSMHCIFDLFLCEGYHLLNDAVFSPYNRPWTIYIYISIVIILLTTSFYRIIHLRVSLEKCLVWAKSYKNHTVLTFFSVIIQEEKNKALADKYCVPLSSVFWLKDKLPYRLNHIKKSLTYQNWFRDSSILKAGLLSSAY